MRPTLVCAHPDTNQTQCSAATLSRFIFLIVPQDPAGLLPHDDNRGRSPPVYNRAISNFRNISIVFNPCAGGLQRGGDRALGALADQLRVGGARVELVATTAPATAPALARSCIEKGADLILAAGGDGTINEVVNGMVHSDVPLGILPFGTANVLAMEIGLGRRVKDAQRMLATSCVERVSLGLLENEANPGGRHFLMMAGVGLDAHIVYKLNARMKSRFGKVAYWLAGFSQIGRRFAEFDVHVNGRKIRSSFALASRVRNYGGDLEIAPTVSLREHDFELVLFSGHNSFAYLKYLAAVLSKRVDRVRGVDVLRASEAQFDLPDDTRVYVQLDGEFAGRLPAQVRIVPRSLSLLLPSAFCAKQAPDASREAVVG